MTHNGTTTTRGIKNKNLKLLLRKMNENKK
jgi:hypothetical protein